MNESRDRLEWKQAKPPTQMVGVQVHLLASSKREGTYQVTLENIPPSDGGPARSLYVSRWLKDHDSTAAEAHCWTLGDAINLCQIHNRRETWAFAAAFVGADVIKSAPSED